VIRLSVKTAVTDLVEALNAYGVPAASDPQNLTPPCVWVQLASIAHDRLDGGGTFGLRLYLIAPDSGTDAALDTFAEWLPRVLAVVDPNTDRDTEAASVYLPDNPSTPLPALQLNVSTLDSILD
jgi:hypothetical protein